MKKRIPRIGIGGPVDRGGSGGCGGTWVWACEPLTGRGNIGT